MKQTLSTGFLALLLLVALSGELFAQCTGVVFTFTTSQTSPACNGAGGAIQVSGVNGGTAGNTYTFSINGSSPQVVNGPPNDFNFIGLTAGLQNITISDGTCDTTISISLPSSPGGIDSATAVVVNANCNANDGSITINALPAGVTVQQYVLNTGQSNVGGQFTGLATGTYSVTMLDANNCTYTVNGLTISNPAGPVGFTTTITPIACAGATGSVQIDGVTGGTPPYKYSINGSAFQSGTSFSGLLPDSYLIAVRDDNGCVITQTIVIDPSNSSNRTCNAGEDVVVEFGENINLSGAASIGSTVFWRPGSSLGDSTILTPLAFPTATTTYTLTTIDDQGCVCIDRVTVFVLPPIRIPNTFTPNGDGTNDLWEIRNTALYDEVNIYLFNRYGDKIWQVKNFEPGKDWDGTVNGTPAPAATYYYILNFKEKESDEQKTYNGAVTIIR